MLDVDAMRAGARARAANRPRGPAIAETIDLSVPDTSVRARLYRMGGANRPTLVFLHGGMWILGDLETHDRFCRRLALAACVQVLAVDYRLAPEHPWPAAVDDAVGAWRWAAGELGSTVAIGGDSAGGCVAALACLRVRDDGKTGPAAQVLICPNTDLTCELAATAPLEARSSLDPDVVRKAAALWAPDPAVRASGRASPLLAEHLDGLPPTLVVTAERDPLRREGEAFAARLARESVPVTHRCELGLPHGFTQGMDLDFPAAGAADARLFADVARLLSAPTV